VSALPRLFRRRYRPLVRASGVNDRNEPNVATSPEVNAVVVVANALTAIHAPR
jgi:hypothetical protein